MPTWFHGRVLPALAALAVAAGSAAWSGCNDNDAEKTLNDAKQNVDDLLQGADEKTQALRDDLDRALNAANNGDGDAARQALEQAAQEGGDRAQEAIDATRDAVNNALDDAQK